MHIVELQTIAGMKMERPGTLSCCPLLVSCQQVPPMLNFVLPQLFQQVCATSTGVNSQVHLRDMVSNIDGLRHCYQIISEENSLVLVDDWSEF